MTERYYRFETPDMAYPPTYFQEMGFSYRGFKVIKADSEYILWEITTMEDAEPAIPLRSRFTTKQKAKACIDSYLAEEERKQQEADNK